MKFGHELDGSRAVVSISGDLDHRECNCLQAFWDCHIPDDLTDLTLDMTDTDDIDGESVAIIVDLVRRHLDHGARVTVRAAPQMLAHTFYKIGLLNHPAFHLDAPRVEESYE